MNSKIPIVSSSLKIQRVPFLHDTSNVSWMVSLVWYPKIQKIYMNFCSIFLDFTVHKGAKWNHVHLNVFWNTRFQYFRITFAIVSPKKYIFLNYVGELHVIIIEEKNATKFLRATQKRTHTRKGTQSISNSCPSKCFLGRSKMSISNSCPKIGHQNIETREPTCGWVVRRTVVS